MVRLSLWVPTEYQSVKGSLLREYLELKALVLQAKVMYEKMAMWALIAQTCFSGIAMLFIPLAWCFGRYNTRSYEYQPEGVMKSGYKLGQLFKGFCAVAALFFLFFGNKKKAAAFKETWSYMFCNEDAWSFLRSMKRFWKGKDDEIRIPKSMETPEVKEAAKVAQDSFGFAYEGVNKEQVKKTPPPVDLECPHCHSKGNATLVGIMGDPKYIRVCIGCKLRRQNRTCKCKECDDLRQQLFEAEMQEKGIPLWADVPVETFSEMDIVEEAQNKHAGLETELQEQAQSVIEEIQGVEAIQEQMATNQVDPKIPEINIAVWDATLYSQALLYLETRSMNGVPDHAYARKVYEAARKWILEKVYWTADDLNPKVLLAYLKRLRNYVPTYAADTSVDQHLEQVGVAWFQKLQKMDPLKAAQTIHLVTETVKVEAGLPPRSPTASQDDVTLMCQKFAEMAENAYQENKKKYKEEMKEQKVNMESDGFSVLNIARTLWDEYFTWRTFIIWLTTQYLEWRQAFGCYRGMTREQTVQKMESDSNDFVQKLVMTRNVVQFVTHLVGAYIFWSWILTPKKPVEMVFEGDHAKGSNANKAKNVRHKKHYRRTKHWDIFKGASSGNINLDDVIQLVHQNQVYDEMTYSEFRDLLDSRGSWSDLLPDAAGRVHFIVKSTGYGGYAMQREGFVDEGFSKKVETERKKVFEEKPKTKRQQRYEQAVETMKQIKKNFKEKKVCDICMLKHSGPCKHAKFGVTPTVLTTLRQAHEAYFQPESVLNNTHYLTADDFCGRVGKLYVEGSFQMNCFLISDKVIVLRHAFGENYEQYKDAKTAQKNIDFKFPSATLKPKAGYVQFEDIEDFIVFPVQVAQKLGSISLRKPKMCEPVMIMAYIKEQINPAFAQGIAGTNGHHSCSTTYGFCAAPLMSLNDKMIVGFHCAGGDFSNRFYPVTEKLLEFLKTPLN